MTKVSPKEFAQDWGSGLKGSTEKIRRGVARVEVSPTEQAAKASGKWLAKVSAEETQRKFEAGLKKVSKEDWQTAMTEKGVGRIAAGVEGAKGKVEQFAERLLPHIDAGKREIENMPSLTIEDSIERASTFMRHMSKFKNE